MQFSFNILAKIFRSKMSQKKFEFLIRLRQRKILYDFKLKLGSVKVFKVLEQKLSDVARVLEVLRYKLKTQAFHRMKFFALKSPKEAELEKEVQQLKEEFSKIILKKTQEIQQLRRNNENLQNFNQNSHSTFENHKQKGNDDYVKTFIKKMNNLLDFQNLNQNIPENLLKAKGQFQNDPKTLTNQLIDKNNFQEISNIENACEYQILMKQTQQ